MSWQVFALGSAFFAALTAILAKVGVEGVNSDLATLIRTAVILVFTLLLVTARQEWTGAGLTGRTVLFLILSGLATGLSWLCYFRALQLGQASQVAPVDKLSVALAVMLAVVFLGEKLTWKMGLGVVLILAGTLLMLA